MGFFVGFLYWRLNYMYYIKLIKEFLNCDDDFAKEVLENMGEYRLSSLSKEEILQVVKNIVPLLF